MRLLYLNIEDLSTGEAAGRVHYWAVCRELRDLGCQVSVVAPRYRGAEIAMPEGVSSILMPVPFKNYISLLLFELMLIATAPFVVARHKPQAVLVRGGGPGCIPGLVFLMYRALGVPVVLECNGIVWQEFEKRGFSRAVVAAMKFSAWQQAWAANRIIGVTKEIAEIYSALAGKPVELAVEIPNGVTARDFSITPQDRAASREAMGVPADRFVVGYVGSFSVWHNIPGLLDAAKRLGETYGSDILIVAVGRGEMFAMAEERKAADGLANLWLPGPAAREALHNWMQCFDVGVCTNAPVHGSPLKLFEYLACGIPILGSGSPQVVRIIEEEDAGIVLMASEGAAIAAAIEMIYRDRPHWQEVGARNRRLAETKYSWRHVAERVLEVCRDTAAPAAPTTEHAPSR